MDSIMPVSSGTLCRRSCKTTLELNIQWSEGYYWRSRSFYLHHKPWYLILSKAWHQGRPKHLQYALHMEINGTFEDVTWACTIFLAVRLRSQTKAICCLPSYEDDYAVISNGMHHSFPFLVDEAQLTKDGYMKEGVICLEIDVKLEVLEGLSCPIPRRKEVLLTSLFSTEESFKTSVSALADCKQPDLILMAKDGSEWKAHSVFLKTHSTFLRKVIDQGSIELPDGEANRVQLIDVSSRSLDLMLKFAYADFSLAVKHIEKASPEYLRELIFATAKYEFQDLLELAAIKLLEWLSPENAVDTLRFLKQFKVPGEIIDEFKAYVWENIKDVVDSA